MDMALPPSVDRSSGEGFGIGSAIRVVARTTVDQGRAQVTDRTLKCIDERSEAAVGGDANSRRA